MKLSTRSRYGFRAALELAVEYGKGPIQIKIIAQREDISNKYLEQIIAILKSSGLVISFRGPKGGYMLAKPPKEIKLSQIFTVLEGSLSPVVCLEHPEFCPRCGSCVTRQLWSEIQEALFNVLDSRTLQDLVDRMERSKENDNFQI